MTMMRWEPLREMVSLREDAAQNALDEAAKTVRNIETIYIR